MKVSRIILLAMLLAPALLCAQGSAGTGGYLEPRFLVDMPTAGMLVTSSYAIDLEFFNDGGMLLGLSTSLLHRVSFGISYGGTKLIGSGSPVMNAVPGFNFRFRLTEESKSFPALVLGFDSQGKSAYLKDKKRYTIKSPGFFAVGSMNFSMLGFFSIHGGVNYSLENADNDRDVNTFAGVEKTIGPRISVVVEYNAGINDSHGDAVGAGRGYLNLGLKWAIGGGLTMAVALKDLTKNGDTVSIGNRIVAIEYARFF